MQDTTIITLQEPCLSNLGHIRDGQWVTPNMPTIMLTRMARSWVVTLL